MVGKQENVTYVRRGQTMKEVKIYYDFKDERSAKYK